MCVCTAFVFSKDDYRHKLLFGPDLVHTSKVERPEPAIEEGGLQALFLLRCVLGEECVPGRENK